MIVVDTGPSVATANRKDRAHEICLDLLRDLRSKGKRLLLPGTVTAEVGFLIEKVAGPQAEAEFLEDVVTLSLSRSSLPTMRAWPHSCANTRTSPSARRTPQ